MQRVKYAFNIGSTIYDHRNSVVCDRDIGFNASSGLPNSRETIENVSKGRKAYISKIHDII